MRNYTSDGIRKIPMPVGNFKDIDPKRISTGSLAVDNKRNVIGFCIGRRDFTL